MRMSVPDSTASWLPAQCTTLTRTSPFSLMVESSWLERAWQGLRPRQKPTFSRHAIALENRLEGAAFRDLRVRFVTVAGRPRR